MGTWRFRIRPSMGTRPTWAGACGALSTSAPTKTTIVGSTFSDNEAAIRGGGVYNRRGLMIIQFSTITDNEAPAGEGSGVASRGDNPAGGDPARTEIYSSIVAGNVHSDADIVAGGNPSWQSHGYNLIGTGNSLAAFNAAGDQTLVLNPMLAPLADYGGPTMTHALLAGSPAIDAGNPSAIAGIGNVPALDQRVRRAYSTGMARPAHVSISARSSTCPTCISSSTR